MRFAWNIDCGFSALSRHTMSNLHFKASLIFTTLVRITTSEPNPPRPHPQSITSCTFCLKGASNVAYVSDVSVLGCIIWEGEKKSRFALQLEWYGTLRALLKAINSVDNGDTDVLKVCFLLCSLASKCSLTGAVMGRRMTGPSPTSSTPFSYTLKMKSPGTKKAEYLMLVFVYFSSQAETVFLDTSWNI